MAAGCEPHEVCVGAGVAVEKRLKARVVDLFGKVVLQAAKRGETSIVDRNLIGVEGEDAEAPREVFAIQVRLPGAKALGIVLNEHVESGLAVKYKREGWEVAGAGIYELR